MSARGTNQLKAGQGRAWWAKRDAYHDAALRVATRTPTRPRLVSGLYPPNGYRYKATVREVHSNGASQGCRPTHRDWWEGTLPDPFCPL